MGSGRVPSRGCLSIRERKVPREALTLNGVYVPFTDIGGSVLRMLAATRGIKVSDADAAELTDRFATMPPHPEVPAALRGLRDHGFRLFTLTDNALEISGRQLDRAGVLFAAVTTAAAVTAAAALTGLLFVAISVARPGLTAGRDPAGPRRGLAAVVHPTRWP
jgi:hypothetical protein